MYQRGSKGLKSDTYFDIRSVWWSDWIVILQNVFFWDVQIIKCKSPGYSPETLVRVILFLVQYFTFFVNFEQLIFLGKKIRRRCWTAALIIVWNEPFLMETIPHVRIRWVGILFLLRRALCFLQMWLIRSKNDTNLPKMTTNTPKAYWVLENKMLNASKITHRWVI